MGLDLRKVAHFVAVAEERSMTRAATRLHLSQQALSMSMRALERELGVPLLDRSSRGVTLLASGQAFYADAVPLLTAATAAVGRVLRADRGEPELLRIGHTPSVTGIEVTELLAAAPAHHAGAAVQVVAVLPEDLRDRSIDVALSRAAAPPGDMAGYVMAHHRLRLAVRSGARPVPAGGFRAAPPGRPGAGHPAGDDGSRQRRGRAGHRAAGTGARGSGAGGRPGARDDGAGAGDLAPRHALRGP